MNFLKGTVSLIYSAFTTFNSYQQSCKDVKWNSLNCKIIQFCTGNEISIILLRTVDCTNAGKGKLEVSVEKDERAVLCSLKETHTDVYSASFTPILAGHYKIAVAYNKAEIRGKFINNINLYKYINSDNEIILFYFILTQWSDRLTGKFLWKRKQILLYRIFV